MYYDEEMEPAPTGLSAFWRRAVIVTGIAGALVLAYLLRGVLVPLFFAFLLAYALDPFVDRLESWKVPRTVGAILVMVALFGIFSLFLAFAVPYFAEELRAAAADLPAQVDGLRPRIDPFLLTVFNMKLPHTLGELAPVLARRRRRSAIGPSARSATSRSC